MKRELNSYRTKKRYTPEGEKREDDRLQKSKSALKSRKNTQTRKRGLENKVKETLQKSVERVRNAKKKMIRKNVFYFIKTMNLE